MKLFALSLLIVFSVNLSAQVSRDEAVDIVISEIIAPDSVSDHHLYSKYDKMSDNDTLWLDGFMDYYTCPFAENWVFFIDDMPIAFWAHDCRIVFMSTENAEYEVIDGEWPPHPFLSDYEFFLEHWEWILGTGIIPDPDNEEFFAIYPNPFRDQLKIDIEIKTSNSFQYKLYDSKGCIVFSGNIEKHVILRTEDLKAGIYFLAISQKGKTLINKKLVKAH